MRRLETPSPGSPVRALAGVCAAVLVLGVGLAPLFGLDRLSMEGHALGLNDQAGYITTARWLADRGELRSHLVYPSQLENPDFRVYMPGHYAVLALSYRLLGDAPLTWRLPSMLSFVTSAACAFLLAWRFYGPHAGILAAFLFCSYPLAQAYAFTAMPQLPFTATGAAALAGFAWLPPATRHRWVPVLLIPPFLFRETGALLVLPMAASCAAFPGPKRVRAVVLAGLGAVFVLSLVHVWQVRSGKEAFVLSAWLERGEYNYDDAIRPPAEPSARAWVSGLARNAVRNGEVLTSHFAARDMVAISLCALAVLAALSCAAGLVCRDGFALGAGLLPVCAFALVTFLYDWEAYRGIRSLTFTLPGVAAGASGALVRFHGRVRARLPRGSGALLVLAGTAVVAASLAGTRELSGQMTAGVGQRLVDFMEGLDIDDDKLLVSPWEISLDYAYQHYPVRWSFPPANEETLLLLGERFEIGTLIVFADAGRMPYSASSLGALGLRHAKTVKLELPGRRPIRLAVFQAAGARTGRPREPRGG